MAGQRAVILVEGDSDRCALETLARRRDVDLAAEGVAVQGIGGATNIRRALADHAGDGVAVAGLCDLAEEHWYRRGLQAAGLLPGQPAGGGSLADLEAAGFFVCVPDLEGELIRACGVDAVLELIAAEGELASFRLLQRQPAHRQQPTIEQLHRFMGTRSGRKSLYACRLAQALEPGHAPRPLDGVLAHVLPGWPAG